MDSFLSTPEWLEFQKQIGHPAWRFDDGHIKANIIRHDGSLGKNYLYVPHGPSISVDNVEGGIKNELVRFADFIKNLAGQEKSIFIKLEPLEDKVVELLFPFGLKKSAKSVQPQRTAILDLQKSSDELLSAMHHKTRYNIKLAQQHGVVIKSSRDVNIFWDLLQKTTQRDQFSAHFKEYYSQLLALDGNLKTDLLLAYHDEKPIAGAIILTHGTSAYYLHGASDYEYRNLMAPYALHWHIIENLKIQGVQQYDFWGIDADRWPGVTRFKLGFGARVVERPGAFDIPLSKFWYWLYTLR